MHNEIEEKFHDECGVFGIYLNNLDDGFDAAKTTFFGIYALQHRGQESAGIAVADGHKIELHKGLGLTTDALNMKRLNALKGNIAIGHVRYSTTGFPALIDAQPMLFHYRQGMMSIACNGNLTNSVELNKKLSAEGAVFQTTTDAELMANVLSRNSQVSMEEALVKCLPEMKGAFAAVILTEDCLLGFRDPMGIRPLCIGELRGNYILASESASLNTLGAKFIRDVKPGEVIIVDKDGYRARQALESTQHAHCIFEYIYFARPDSTIDGTNVYMARKELGRQLAREHQIDADLVISVPDSGTPSAMGFAEQARLPFEEGLMKNRYVGRTFIIPSQALRELGVRLKLNPIKEIVQGKRIVMVDDSIVRGTTSKQIVQMLREAGATEVHMAVASPPTKYPCYYGIDTSRREELIANTMSENEIANFIGVDSLQYITKEGMLKCMNSDERNFCTACFSGQYPIEPESIE